MKDFNEKYSQHVKTWVMEAKRWNLRKNSKEVLEIKEMKNVFGSSVDWPSKDSVVLWKVLQIFFCKRQMVDILSLADQGAKSRILCDTYTAREKRDFHKILLMTFDF